MESKKQLKARVALLQKALLASEDELGKSLAHEERLLVQVADQQQRLNASRAIAKALGSQLADLRTEKMDLWVEVQGLTKSLNESNKAQKTLFALALGWQAPNAS